MKAVPEPEGNLEGREVGVTLIPNPGPVLFLDSYCPMAWGHGNSTLSFLLQNLLVQVAQIQHGAGWHWSPGPFQPLLCSPSNWKCIPYFSCPETIPVLFGKYLVMALFASMLRHYPVPTNANP